MCEILGKSNGYGVAVQARAMQSKFGIAGEQRGVESWNFEVTCKTQFSTNL